MKKLEILLEEMSERDYDYRSALSDLVSYDQKEEISADIIKLIYLYNVDNSYFINKKIATFPNCPQPILEKLSLSPSGLVRRAAIKNKNNIVFRNIFTVTRNYEVRSFEKNISYDYSLEKLKFNALNDVYFSNWEIKYFEVVETLLFTPKIERDFSSIW